MHSSGARSRTRSPPKGGPGTLPGDVERQRIKEELRRMLDLEDREYQRFRKRLTTKLGPPKPSNSPRVSPRRSPRQAPFRPGATSYEETDEAKQREAEEREELMQHLHESIERLKLQERRLQEERGHKLPPLQASGSTLSL